jgi:pilus assembly protein FimV
MNTINRIGAYAFLAVLSLSVSPSAWSLGLGDATVESFLNQPLNVRIDLISQESDDLESITAKLASADDYELIGASREAIPVPVRFSVEDIDGDAYLRASSNLPIGSPVIRLIVEVNWSSGRMLREYTLFLDPPVVPAAAPAPRIEQRTSPPAPAPAPAAATDTPEDRPVTTSSPSSDRVSSSAPAGDEYGPVKSGDTLWEIARDWSRGTGLDINKVMIAIQRENPRAFIKNNINLLKRGEILRMPAVDQVEQIPTISAYQEVAVQSEEFSGGRTSEAMASPATPLLAEEAAPQAPVELEEAAEDAMATDAVADSGLSGDAEELAEESIEDTPAAETLGQLELVPPSEASAQDSEYGLEESEGAADVATTGVLREDLARTEEELFNQQQQNAYLEDRIKELEAQLADREQQQLAADADMANMEERLRQERLAEAAASADAEPWYKRTSTWLIVLLVLLAGAIGWLLSRRGESGAVVAEPVSDPIRDIKDEAEEVLRVLEDSEEDAADDDAAADDGEPETVIDERTRIQSFDTGDADAEVLDEESSDPEIQLDLARAYTSMGDKEAARVILEEVVANGSEAQQEEAQKMLDLFSS